MDEIVTNDFYFFFSNKSSMELDLADCVELKQPQKSWKLTELVQEL